MPLDDDLDGIVLSPEDGNVFRRDKGKPELRVVTDADELSRGRPKGRKDTAPRRSRDWRLPRSDKPWVRLWVSELNNHFQLPAPFRLLMVLRHRTFEDRDEIALTKEIAQEAGVPPRERSRVARHLEQLGLLQVRRDGQQQLMVELTGPPR